MWKLSLRSMTDRAVRPVHGKAALAGLLVCLGFSGALMAADGATPGGSLTVVQIVEKHIGARGGLPAWHAVRTMSWTGKLDAGSADSTKRSARYIQSTQASKDRRKLAEVQAAADKQETDQQVQLPFRLSMERPRKSHLELDFAGKTALQVYDGTNGWKVRPYLNRLEVEPFTAEEAQSEASREDLDGPLIDYAAKGTKVAFEAVEPVEGHEAYRLKLTAGNGDVQHIWIDAQNFLDVKVEGAPRRMDGKMHSVLVYQRDFRAVHGVMIPYVLETTVDGYKDSHRMVIEKAVVNPPLDAALFVKPRV